MARLNQAPAVSDQNLCGYNVENVNTAPGMHYFMAADTVWGMHPNRAMARQLAVRDIPSLVYDAVNLEGVAMTLPEVQTLLDGITVGGHKVSDQNMALNQAAAWKYLFSLVAEDRFTFSRDVALSIHNIAGKEEALEWGAFRTGNVTIAGSEYEPPSSKELDNAWAEIESELASCDDVYDLAITAFLRMVRAQFFWDVNRRMGRFMMNGILLSHGFPIINVPAKRQIEFNRLMLDFYTTADMTGMSTFLRSCLNEKIIDNFKPDRRLKRATAVLYLCVPCGLQVHTYQAPLLSARLPSHKPGQKPGFQLS